MTLSTAMQGAPWRVGDTSSCLVLDIAAGRPLDWARPPSDDESQLAVHHGLIGLMADHDNLYLRSAALPIYARLAARQAVMRRHLHRVLTALRAAGVRATVVKGLHLAEWAYANPTHRTTTDIDLLVPSDEVDRAIAVLAEDEAVQAIPAKTPKADKRNIPLSDPSGVRFTIDLHWDLFSYTQLRECADGATDWAWEQATFVEDHPLGPIWVLPEAARIAFLCTHALLDHRFRLILFRDLAEVAARNPDWEALLRFVERWKLRSAVYLALLIAAGTCDAAVPRQVLETMRKSSSPLALTERMLPRTNLTRFDGHRSHPLNLAIVLVHDDRRARVRLLIDAPAAFPRWQARVTNRRPKPLTADAGQAAAPPLVLHLLPADLARGAQTYAQAMRQSLDDHHARHLTMTIFRAESVVLETDVELDIAPSRRRRLGFDVRAAWALRRALRADPPAVLVAHGGESLKYAAVVAARKTKLVYYKIGTSSVHFESWTRRMLYSSLLRRFDIVAGVSQEMVDEARILLKVAPSRLRYIANGRDPASFTPAVHTGEDPVTFCFIGHLTRTKRPLTFIDVMEALQDRGHSVRGIMVGDGPLENDVEVAAARTNNTESLGRRDDVPDLLVNADVFLFTSMVEGEGMPGVLIEAGLAGVPTVSTDVPGARTIVQDGVTGFVIDPGNFEGMVRACEQLSNDPELRERMGLAAREHCMKEFTLEASAQRWREVLDNLIET